MRVESAGLSLRQKSAYCVVLGDDLSRSRGHMSSSPACGSHVVVRMAKSIFSIVSSAIMEMDSIGPSAVTTENPVAVW